MKQDSLNVPKSGSNRLPAILSGTGALLALLLLVVGPLFPPSSASSKKATTSIRPASALVDGTITVRMTGQFAAAPTDTFTLTRQLFTGSIDCSAGGGTATMVPNVDSTTGHTFSITAADSVLLTAPQFSDGGGQLLGWTSPTGGNFTPIPNTNNTQICIQGFEDAAHTFTAQYSPGIQTLDATCTNVKTLFNVGETVCVRVTGTAASAGTPWNVFVAGGSPNECSAFFTPMSITMETQTVLFTLPSSNAEIPGVCSSSPTTEIRGNWRAGLRDQGNNIRGQKNFRLHDEKNPIAELVIFKDTTDNQGYPPGGFVNYRVIVQNNGPDAATNVVVTESVPANTTFLSWTQTNGPAFTLSGPTAGEVTATIASLAADAFATFELAVQIDNGVPNNTLIDNTVSVTSSTEELIAFNNTAMFQIQVSTNACQLVCADIMTEATDMSGAVVNFTPMTVGGGSCGAIQCTPTSGTTFPVGTTTVSCIGINQGFCQFTVTVTPMGGGCMLTCPANVTVSNDLNQCGAVVNYSAPETSGNCETITCSPPSGSFFPVGTTTVACLSTAGPICMFTVTVNDTQDPSFTCPTSITTVSGQGCSSLPTSVVNFSTPVATDNCPGVSVVCTPMSGSSFPVGTTTVSCTATDTAGRTANCSFSVTVFGACLQDDSSSGKVVVFNPATGEYRFCCNGTVIAEGIGTVIRQGCNVTIQDNRGGRRVLIKSDTSLQKGTASLQQPVGTMACSISDKKSSGGLCQCASLP